MSNKPPLYLYTLHYEKDLARYKHPILARNPYEAASLVGGEFIPRKEGVCESSTNPDELGLCGKVRFCYALFHEMDETDRALAGMYTHGSLAYSRGGLGLLTKPGEDVELFIRERHITVPDTLR